MVAWTCLGFVSLFPLWSLIFSGLLFVRWGFDAVGRGEVVVTARWYYDKDFDTKTPVLAASFMGGKNKVRSLERVRSMCTESRIAVRGVKQPTIIKSFT